MADKVHEQLEIRRHGLGLHADQVHRGEVAAVLQHELIAVSVGVAPAAILQHQQVRHAAHACPVTAGDTSMDHAARALRVAATGTCDSADVLRLWTARRAHAGAFAEFDVRDTDTRCGDILFYKSRAPRTREREPKLRAVRCPEHGGRAMGLRAWFNAGGRAGWPER